MIYNLISLFILVCGISMLIYPHIANYWNSFTQTRVVANYQDSVEKMDKHDYQQLWYIAEDYNQRINRRNLGLALNSLLKLEYQQTLVVDDSDIMAYIDIPKIDCHLPVYHGTSDGVLQVAVGHVEWSSLPIGGEGNHSILTGHTGLPSGKIFTDLDRMEIGDNFTIKVLDQEYHYQVDHIMSVLPDEVKKLQRIPGEDLCTLITCTPYGVNSHRLCVRGKRTFAVADVIEEQEKPKEQEAPYLSELIMMILQGLLTMVVIFMHRKNTYQVERKQKRIDSYRHVNKKP